MSDSTRDILSAVIVLSVVAFPLAKLAYSGAEIVRLL